MDATHTGVTLTQIDQLLLVLQEMQQSLKRLEDHLKAQNKEGSQSSDKLEGDRARGDTDDRNLRTHGGDSFKKNLEPMSKQDDDRTEARPEDPAGDAIEVTAQKVLSNDESKEEDLSRTLQVEAPKEDLVTDSNDLDIISPLSTKDLNFSDEPSEPLTLPIPTLPSSAWCLLKANTLPYEDSLQWKRVRVGDNVLDPPVESPPDWVDLERDDGLPHWQYYKPLWYNSGKFSYIGTGRGSPSVNVERCLNSLKEPQTHQLVYAPYSQCATSQKSAYISTNDSSVLSFPIYENPWSNLRNDQLEAAYSRDFGGLWRVPGDTRLSLRLTSQNRGALEGLKVRFEHLQSSRGFLHITDIDRYNRFATYTYGGSLTAAAAESLHLDIGPVGPFVLLGSSTINLEDYKIAGLRQNLNFRTAIWRRLIYCRDIALAFDSPLWTSPKAKEIFNLHRLHQSRTADLFQATRHEHLFHISWTELDRNVSPSTQNLPTDMPTVVKSYTVQPFPSSDRHWPLGNHYDGGEWTLLVLAPEGPQRESPETYPYALKTDNLLLATLSAILQGLTWGLEGWKGIYENLPLSIKCFWVVDRIQTITPRLVHTAAEWDEFKQQHLTPFARFEEIEAQLAMIDDLRQKFERLSKRAETTISTIFNLTSVKEARESRLLGENVKLLTYVTVVFLPLSFCTSMWTINGMFSTGIKGFVVITCILAVITYGTITILLSASARKVSSKAGQKVGIGLRKC